MTALDLIAANLTKPMTHRVTTTYECGKVRTHDVRSAGAAKNWATGERRKIGRTLLDGMTGRNVRVVSVEITEL